MKTYLSLLLLSLTLSFSVAKDMDAHAVEIVIHPVTKNVAMLEGQGGNIGVIHGEDGIFIIDDQFAPLSDKIKQALATLSKEPAKFVINTHWHGDHTGGNENFGKTGSVIVAHENVRRRMSEEQVMKIFDRHTMPAPKAALPVVTFASDVTLHFNGDEIHVFHVEPAHTDGDSIVHFKKNNVFHMGDVFFNGWYPFIDLDSGGNVDGVIAAVKQVLVLADDQSKIIPGHGPLATKADLQAYHDMLVKTRNGMAALIKSGKSLEEIQAAKPFADLDAKLGGGFINPDTFLMLLHGSLSK